MTMFGPLWTFLSRLAESVRPLPDRFEQKDCRLPTAALLIRIARVESEMSEARRKKLHAVLKSRFELDDRSTKQLISDAAAAERSAIDLYHFTRQLNAGLDDEERRGIVKMMWEIIYVNGTINESENNIIWRAADLLSVPSRQRIELRQQIAALSGQIA
jgi:uncharacterized tellurite resistance protein B-like protein